MQAKPAINITDTDCTVVVKVINDNDSSYSQTFIKYFLKHRRIENVIC